LLAASSIGSNPEKHMKRASRLWASVSCGLALLGAASSAEAKRTGMNLACHNCHEGKDKPLLSAELSSARVEPGQTLTITVTAKHERAKVGGVLVDSKGHGTFELVDPVGTHLFEGIATQATHAMPQTYANGQVQFAFRWVAPATVGTAEFEIWTNAGNDNLMPADDGSTEVIMAVAVGCDGAWYHVDADKDGAGAEQGRVFSCEPMPDRILQGGDCNDQESLVGPGVAETCNNRDDDCDGEIDDGFEPVLLVVDADGDGFGSRTGMSMVGCPPVAGYAPSFDDCNDSNPAINPQATEIVNGVDDNCNGQRDEAVPVAGAGGGGSGGGGGGGSAGGGAVTPPPATTPAEPSGCAFTPRFSGSALACVVFLALLGGVRRRATRRSSMPV
jgi:Putative metal-binding motif